MQEKRYKFSKSGYKQMLYDITEEKISKINGILRVVVIFGMFGFGLLTKEWLIYMLANIGISEITNWLIK